MITDILGGKSGAAEAASSAKQAVAGRRDSDTSPSGFSDALSGFDRDTPSQQSDDDVLQDDGKPSSGEAGMAADTKPAKTKPIIDIRPESLRRTADELRTPIEFLKDVAGKSEERQMTPAEKKLRDALAAAKAIARKSDELHEKGVSQGHAADKTAQQDEDSQLDLSMLDEDDAKIADMLSLLTGDEAKVGELNAMMPKNTTGAQTKRTKDADGRSANVDALAVNDPKRFMLGGAAEGQPLSMPTDADASIPGTRLFRFSNARGDGQNLDMAIEKGSDERVGVEFKSSSNGAAENVTVLDSRRFLGLAPNSNGANLTAALSGDSEWAAAMHPSSSLSNAAAQSSTGSVVNMLKLQMNPHELGSVTATLRLHGDELNVHLTVETRAAYRQLSEDSGGILDALRAQGFSVDQVTISIAPTSDTDAAGGQQGQAGQQGAAEGGRQGHAAGRGQDQAGDRQTSDQGSRDGNDAVSDTAAGTAPDGARPGQLYL
ncbi:flagellar hook-length control protein FliK [Rhizobium puerariae]|uniref:Flagellar hook-length control protein FliK n=1 Tax=Rhizobium puerariae TaxID=1585791 RepID=A0ABV6AHU2_9HYPH